ncbi:hypothetical protein [Sphingopyxis sp. PET50]|uniref:hypothetical protein n=1 Tax=Sphingopyxis sp. PET50 TaxID=2976533 RepID=UPI0021AFC522|nr:hypothetical protein [Sphingopyxis sp. PET50]
MAAPAPRRPNSPPRGPSRPRSPATPRGEALAKGKAQAKRANSKLKDVAEKQPIALVAGAVAIGALLGALLPKGGGRDDNGDA